MIKIPPKASNRNRVDRMKNSILDRYHMGDKIGEGSFGIVYKATHKKTGALVRYFFLMNNI